jgi:hypothetical protein
LPSPDHVHVEVVDALRPLNSLVHHHTEALGALLGPDLAGGVDEVAKEGLLVLPGFGEAGEAIAILGNNENVGGTLGSDVAEGVAEVVGVHLGRGDVSREELVKNSGLTLGC